MYPYPVVQCIFRLITVASRRHRSLNGGAAGRRGVPHRNCNAKRARVCACVCARVCVSVGECASSYIECRWRIAKFSFGSRRWWGRSSGDPQGYWQKSKRAKLSGSEWLSGSAEQSRPNGKRFFLPACWAQAVQGCGEGGGAGGLPFCRLITASKQIRLKLMRRFAFISSLAGRKCNCKQTQWQ